MKLVQTCGACPEQYDVFDDAGNEIGYLRLRHGYFTAQYGGPGGPVVYDAATEGDGVFEYNERDYHLTNALRAIHTYTGDNVDAVVADAIANVTYG